MGLLAWLNPISAVVSGVTEALTSKMKHRQDMELARRQEEATVAAKKLELAQTTQSGKDLIDLQILKNMEKGLGDTWIRRIIITVMSTPFALLLYDVFTSTNYGSTKVKQYFDLVNAVIPNEYILFVVAMVGGYFAINKVANIFKR